MQIGLKSEDSNILDTENSAEEAEKKEGVMKSRNWMVLFVFATLAFGLTTGCPDDSGCTGDPSLCDGGADSDADADGGGDADADGDTPAGRGYLNVHSLPAETAGAAVLVDGTEECTTDCLNLELDARTHEVLLSKAGWVDAPALTGVPRQVEIVNENLTDLTVTLGRDITGAWQDQLGEYGNATMSRCLGWIADYADICVDFDGSLPLGGLVVEGDRVYLPNRGAGYDYAEGQILNEGNRVEFTLYPHIGPPEDYVFTRR